MMNPLLDSIHLRMSQTGPRHDIVNGPEAAEFLVGCLDSIGVKRYKELYLHEPQAMEGCEYINRNRNAHFILGLIHSQRADKRRTEVIWKLHDAVDALVLDLLKAMIPLYPEVSTPNYDELERLAAPIYVDYGKPVPKTLRGVLKGKVKLYRALICPHFTKTDLEQRNIGDVGKAETYGMEYWYLVA